MTQRSPGMPRVDFYVLEQVSADARLRLACKLAERAWSESQKVFVLASGPDEARRLDELLWTYRDGSFVPHDLVEAAGSQPAPVIIGTALEQAPSRDVLLNLAAQVPDGFERFARIVEPLDADVERRQRGRERFRIYRERGFTPQSHTVGATDS